MFLFCYTIDKIFKKTSMNKKEVIELTQIDVTGCKIIGSITGLDKIGPKHIGIILGLNKSDNQVYIAESMHNKYQYDTYNNFKDRYSNNGEVAIYENNGKFTNLEVAQRAVAEISNGGKAVYNLITNNCESFANRAMHNHSTSFQIINTAIGIAVFTGLFWIMKKEKSKSTES